MLILLSSLANAQIAGDGWTTASVLFMGNSYTQFNQGVDQEFSRQLQDSGIAGSQSVQKLTAGGLTLADHHNRVQNPESPWSAVFAERSWQYVVLQDQSQIPGFPESESYWQASAAGAQGLASLTTAQGGHAVLFMTWGRRDGDSQNTSMYPDYSTMQDRLRGGYLRYAELASTPDAPVYVAPVGEAWRVIHDDLVAAGETPTAHDHFVSLYSGDGSHPSSTGTVLISLTMMVTLTGRSVADLPLQVDDDTAARLKDAADRAVLEDPFGDVPLPFVWSTDQLQAAGWSVSHDWMRVHVALDGAQTAGIDTVGDHVLAVVGDSDVGQVTLGTGGELWIRDGVGVVGGVGGGAVVQTGGTLRAGAGTWETGLTQTGGTLELTDWPLEFTGALTLGGTVALPELEGPTLVLRSCAGIDLSGVVSEIPLRVDGCDVIADADWVDTSPPQDTDEPIGGDDPGCGCASGGPLGGLVAVLLAAGVARRRRS